jgi:hypothetical protein
VRRSRSDADADPETGQVALKLMDSQRRVPLIGVQQPEGLADRLALGRREVLGPEGLQERVGEVQVLERIGEPSP